MKSFLYSLLVILCLPWAPLVVYGCTPTSSTPITSHSAIMAKPASQNAVWELAQTNYARYHNESERCRPFIFDALPFFFISTKSKDIARYLLPNGNSAVTIADNNTSDISAPWINITTPEFSSTMFIRPQRIEVGLGLNFFLRFGSLQDSEYTRKKHIWISAFAPLELVRHSLHISTVPTSTEAAVVEAFNQSDWCFGKLSCKPLNKFGLADILFKLGYDFLLNEVSHFALYAATNIPTYHGIKAEEVFEPTIGNLGHVGLGFGLNGDWRVYDTCDHKIAWITDIRYLYFFKRHETRTTDSFFNEDWSRYMQVAESNALGTPLPAINFFTQCVSVVPRSCINLLTLVHIENCERHIELGYNFWWRAQERVCGFGIPDVVIYDIIGTPGLQTSESTATIATGTTGVNAPVSDPSPTVISSLSENTPRIPDIFISTFYASFGKTVECYEQETLISGGAYYDWDHRHTSFSGVGIWLKGSVVF